MTDSLSLGCSVLAYLQIVMPSTRIVFHAYANVYVDET